MRVPWLTRQTWWCWELSMDKAVKVSLWGWLMLMLWSPHKPTVLWHPGMEKGFGSLLCFLESCGMSCRSCEPLCSPLLQVGWCPSSSWAAMILRVRNGALWPSVLVATMMPPWHVCKQSWIWWRSVRWEGLRHGGDQGLLSKGLVKATFLLSYTWVLASCRTQVLCWEEAPLVVKQINTSDSSEM